MKTFIACLLMALSTPALAALKVGAPAPDFTIPASLGGKEFTFRMAEALKKGPVVVYFYPAAFTTGCSIEARDFAQAMPQYQANGASVIGISSDTIATLNKFSVSECQGKFPVGADKDRKVMKSYDATFGFLTGMANRTSYVVSRDGKIAFAHSDMDPEGHVSKTLKAVSDLKR
ncbi:MAG: peroxiredoxin [Pseudomonadota bacterium]